MRRSRGTPEQERKLGLQTDRERSARRRTSGNCQPGHFRAPEAEFPFSSSPSSPPAPLQNLALQIPGLRTQEGGDPRVPEAGPEERRFLEDTSTCALSDAAELLEGYAPPALFEKVSHPHRVSESPLKPKACVWGL